LTLHLVAIDPDPIEIDPRPCELCGLTIDRHIRIDAPEGPEHFCPDSCEGCGLPIDRHQRIDTAEGPEFRCPDLAAADIVRRLEMADPRDRWKHTGEPPPPASVRNSDISARPANNPQPYRTPRSTIAAFLYLVATDDLPRVRDWLAARPKDAPYLLQLLEG
jgi:hypothetical protein